jgi:hypothetical protein
MASLVLDGCQCPLRPWAAGGNYRHIFEPWHLDDLKAAPAISAGNKLGIFLKK